MNEFLLVAILAVQAIHGFYLMKVRSEIKGLTRLPAKE